MISTSLTVTTMCRVEGSMKSVTMMFIIDCSTGPAIIKKLAATKRYKNSGMAEIQRMAVSLKTVLRTV